ncbi:MAG TPA: hypothetical protein VFZ61_00520 [Polyangiales bacterium]
MARALLLCLFLVSGVLLGGAARADAQAAKPVVVAMESSLGIGGAAKVRAQLRRQSGLPIWSVSESHAHGAKPSVMLVVELDRGQKVTVVYLDDRGVTDVLTAPLAADSADVTSIVATLAAALLARHPALPAGTESTAERVGALSRDASTELANASRALYAALGRMGVAQRRTGRLSAEDF